MVTMTLTSMTDNNCLIVGASMQYRGLDHFKQYVAISEDNYQMAIGEGVATILACLKRPCQIDLRTDHHWLKIANWGEDEIGSDLAAAMRKHQIIWNNLAPGCKAILDVQEKMKSDMLLHQEALSVFGL